MHYSDVMKLAALLQRFVEAGHSVFVVEHNAILLRHCNHLVELGPEGVHIHRQSDSVRVPERAGHAVGATRSLRSVMPTASRALELKRGLTCSIEALRLLKQVNQ